ncbi:MAG: recombinase family protein [Desulfuromonadales bacterium]
MASGKFVGYIRVSTVTQERSGLGKEAQLKAIHDYLNGGNWELIATFEETESGKLDDRIELQKALERCKITGATLVIAKLDRLSRDSHFIGSIMKSGIEFIAVDMPAATKFTIHILAAVAEHEREMISQRTKAALQAKKARNEKMGNPQNLNVTAAAKGRALGTIATAKKNAEYSSKVYPTVKELADQGMSLRGIARELNQRNILTARGTAGGWSAVTVSSVLKRGEV